MIEATRDTASNGMFARPNGMPTARSARHNTPINPATTMPVSGNAFVTSLGLPSVKKSSNSRVCSARRQFEPLLHESAPLTLLASASYNTFPAGVVHAEFRANVWSTFCADSPAGCNPENR